MKSKFFEAVSRIAEEKGFEDRGVEKGLLQLYLDGNLVAQIDESGSMLYHPYKEVLTLMDDIMDARRRISEVQYTEDHQPFTIRGWELGQELKEYLNNNFPIKPVLKIEDTENELLRLVGYLEEHTEGLCRVGLGPGGMGVSTDDRADLSVCLVFDPPMVQEDELFPEMVDHYRIYVQAYDQGMNRELTSEVLGEMAKGENLFSQKVAETVLELSKEPLCVSAEMCREAVAVLLDRMQKEVYGGKESLSMVGMTMG